MYRFHPKIKVLFYFLTYFFNFLITGRVFTRTRGEPQQTLESIPCDDVARASLLLLLLSCACPSTLSFPCSGPITMNARLPDSSGGGLAFRKKQAWFRSLDRGGGRRQSSPVRSAATVCSLANHLSPLRSAPLLPPALRRVVGGSPSTAASAHTRDGWMRCEWATCAGPSTSV